MNSNISRPRAGGCGLMVALVAMTFIPGPVEALPHHAIAHPLPPSELLTPEQDHFVDLLRDDPEALHVVIVSLDPISDPEDLTLFEVDVPTLGHVELEVIDSSDAGDGMRVWRGYDPAERAEGILVIRGSDVVGTIRASGVVASLRPLGGGHHVVVVWDFGVQALCEVGLMPPGPMPTPNPAPTPPPTPCPSLPAPGTPCDEIWVVVGFTETSEQRAGVPPQTIYSVIVEAVELANLAYQESGLNLKLVLKNSFLVPNHTECCTSVVSSCYPALQDRDDLIAPIPELQIVHDMRNLYAADVAVLIAAYENCGGLAPIPDCPYDPANEANAFAIVVQKTASSLFSLAHEIGHIQAAWHNPEMLYGYTRTPAFEYSHGYCNQTSSAAHPNGWNTIMSYDRDNSGNLLCEDYVGHFANPDVFYPPTPPAGGVATGDITTHDVARVFEDTACTVAGYRVPASVTLSPSNVELKTGKKVQIQANVKRNGVPVQGAEIRFTSMNTATALILSSSPVTNTAGQAGVVIEGVSQGNTLITALSSGGHATAQLQVKASFWRVVGYILIAVVAIILIYFEYQRRQGSGL